MRAVMTSTTALLIGIYFILAIHLSVPHPTLRRGYDNTATKIVACYFSPTSIGPNETQIESNLCSHILFAAAMVAPQGIKAKNPKDIDSWTKLVMLKKKNPKLKIIVSLDSGFETVLENETRTLESFVNGTKKVLTQYNLDGVDLAWEYPGSQQRQNLSIFIQALSSMLHSEGKILSLATSKDVDVFLNGFIPDVVNRYVDFLSVMAFGYYSYSPKTPYVNYSSPLDQVSISMKSYLSKSKINASKILLGFPAHGYSWNLADPLKNNLHAKVTGPANPPTPTLKQICFLQSTGTTTIIDLDNAVSYTNYGYSWISFNGLPGTLSKAMWVLNNHIGGISMFSLSDDDYDQTCGKDPFPILRTVRNVFGYSTS